MIRIVIADDHPIVREGFGAIVSAEDDVEVVAHVADGIEALAAVRDHSPDVVLMDLRMPRMDGVEAIRRIHAEHPAVKIIVLTTYSSDELVFDAIRAGAQGYLLKDVSPENLMSAIRLVKSGGSLIQPVTVQRLLDVQESGGRGHAAPSEALTPRELEVLEHMARGSRNREIAEKLFIAERTVKIHVANVTAKLDAHNRTEAVVKALDLGLIERDRPAAGS